MPLTTDQTVDPWECMAYFVNELDDSEAVDPEDHVVLPKATEAMLAYAVNGSPDPPTDKEPIPGHRFSLFVRNVLVDGITTPALWDLGCNRSLMPYELALRLPNAILDRTATKTLETAGGIFRTEGTLRTRIYLTPTASVTHTFVVSKHSPRLLIGGDILATCFAAVHFSLDGTFHLYGSGPPEIVRLCKGLSFPYK